ncbi:MAG: serine/threonine-protein kinase [Candidatus Melainabacteria bacterium]|nr:serine/threonine-protein kinase [Candidatus Melainabacteria bacterium]
MITDKARTKTSYGPEAVTLMELIEAQGQSGSLTITPSDDGAAETGVGAPSVSLSDSPLLIDSNSLTDVGIPANEGGASESQIITTKDGFEVHPNIKICAAWAWSLRAPIFLLGAIALVPKLILLWIFIILAKPVASWTYKRCPQSWRARLRRLVPNSVSNSHLITDLSDGADQGLPFILFWLYLFCAPFALGWIALNWLAGFINPQSIDTRSDGTLVLTQNKRLGALHSENNFYHSRAFAVVLLTVFALGIPAFVTFAVFEKLEIENLMKQSHVIAIAKIESSAPSPKAKMNFGVASRPDEGDQSYCQAWMQSSRVMDDAELGHDWPWIRHYGVEPTKASLFFVHFYLVSLASAICVLFFRAWFSFPLNFLSNEHDVVFTAYGIKRKLMRSWFLSVITFNRFAIPDGADSLKWSEVRTVRYVEDGFLKLCPLPETTFNKESRTYQMLNKLAALIDGMSNRQNAFDYLVFSNTTNKYDLGQHIKIATNDLSREQRARLYYSVQQWAPNVVFEKSATEQLLGSTVLNDNRYTQLWFDMLTSRVQTKRKNLLPPGEILKNGEYVIDNRISSGGQATTYLATMKSGDKCVLKEFILSTSTASGAMIESAREFEAEVSLLSQLNHPGIVKLQDFFSEDRRLYVVLEYIEGQSLRQMVQSDGKLSDDRVIEMTRSICDVLEYLHGCNPPIVHRDITPENILVEPSGTIKVIDFSLAVKQDGRQTTDSCAKQAFTPPEQFREEVCVQSDIYALGATMHFLLTAQSPKPISCSSPQVKEPNVSNELNAIVERATQLDLNKRYECIEWLKVDLCNLDQHSPDSVTNDV